MATLLKPSKPTLRRVCPTHLQLWNTAGRVFLVFVAVLWAERGFVTNKAVTFDLSRIIEIIYSSSPLTRPSLIGVKSHTLLGFRELGE